MTLPFPELIEQSLTDNNLPPLTNLGCTVNKTLDQDKLAIADWSQSQARKFTYREIDSLANSMAVFLHNRGLQKGDKIAIIGKNSVEYIIALYGIFRIGAVAVPLNYKAPLSDIKFMIQDSGAKLVFSDGGIPVANNLNLFITMSGLKEEPHFDPVEINDDDEGILLYTSGTSGNPKGVSISHKSHLWMVERFRNKDQRYGPKRVCLISAPLHHMNGLSTIQSSLAGHSTILLLPEFNATAYLKMLNKYKVNTLYVVTPMIAMLVNEPAIKNIDLSPVKVIFMASAPLSGKLLENVRQHFPNALLVNSYGLTEAGPRIFGPHPDTSIPRPSLSVGHPTPEIQVRIVDGILQIKSPSMLKTYHNRPDLYEQSVTDDGYFITNDLFTVDENGFYYFQGRADDMFKSGGNTIYPTKIEEVLETHPAVDSAIVLGIEDDIKGKKPYAFVVRKDNVDEHELKQFVLENAASYMHPRKIWFLEEFPKLSTNKIDKKQLTKLAEKLLTKTD